MIIMVAMQGGSSGAFLQSIIAQWITDDRSPMQFGTNGDCHDYKRRYEQEYLQPGWQKFPFSDWALLRRRVGVSRDLPIVVWSRCLEPWDEITQHHPNWHHVFIHVEAMEKLWTATNHFYKMLPQFGIGDGSPIDLGYRMAREKNILPEVTDLNSLSYEQCHKLILCQQHYEVDHSKCFQHSAECNRQYPGRRTDINFLDIMTRPDRVFARLQPILKTEPNLMVYANYAAYLECQYSLISKKASWLHDRLMGIHRAIQWCNRKCV